MDGSILDVYSEQISTKCYFYVFRLNKFRGRLSMMNHSKTRKHSSSQAFAQFGLAASGKMQQDAYDTYFVTIREVNTR